MAHLSKDKLLLGATFVLVAASAATFGWLAYHNARAPRGPAARVQLGAEPYTPTAGDAPAVKTDTWSLPVAQTRGRDWVYDTFTPPEIFYNARSKHFTVKPPLSAGDELPEEAFGLELVAVRPEPFRLQLIGYVGGEGDWRGTFEKVASGEVFLASAGHRVADLALSIKRLEVTTVAIVLPASMTTRQRVATAVVHDERTGRDVTLTHRARQFTGGVSAFVAVPGATATRELRQGETFKVGDASYTVERIQLAPASVDITKESTTLVQPDRRTLTPREADDAPAPVDSPAT
ncbi:MAG: hypothetical protein EXS32_14055 [Opitutus sp.]|nr:hypothetical protein [Opitutus sp.]